MPIIAYSMLIWTEKINLQHTPIKFANEFDKTLFNKICKLVDFSSSCPFKSILLSLIVRGIKMNFTFVNDKSIDIVL